MSKIITIFVSWDTKLFSMSSATIYSIDGSACSFEQVYKNYYVRLINYARTKTGDIAAAEDLVHELLADIYIQKRQIENIEAYMFGALKKRILNYWRHQDVRNKLEVHRLEPGEETIQNRIEIKDLMNAVNLAAKNLPTQCQQVFNLKQNHLSNKEIASHLNISIKTVEAHFTKALHYLKRNLSVFIFQILLFLLR